MYYTSIFRNIKLGREKIFHQMSYLPTSRAPARICFLDYSNSHESVNEPKFTMEDSFLQKSTNYRKLPMVFGKVTPTQ